jgi:hypothetical protein
MYNLKRDNTPIWLGKLVNYEYWPTWFFYIPIGVYVLYLMAKSRSIVYFTNVNPSIKDSGIYRYSKFAVLEHISEKYKPKTILIKSGEKPDILKSEFTFPLIAKPDMGERGKGVSLISDMLSLKKYAENIQQDFIIQEYCDFPNEAAIFYIRKPSEEKGKITSFTTKEFLCVNGDGLSTIRQLMSASFRDKLQIYRQTPEFLNTIPRLGEVVKIEPIGNHNRGTRFINANHLISDALTDIFDKISTSIPGFYYGRHDLKFKNLQDLESGKNFKIVELNGINSEPVHIYDQRTGLWNAYKDCIKHYKSMYEISQENYALGHKRSGALTFWKTIFKT